MQNLEDLEKAVFMLNIDLKSFLIQLPSGIAQELDMLNSNIKTFVDHKENILKSPESLLFLLENAKQVILSVPMADNLAILEKADLIVEINTLIKNLKEIQKNKNTVL